MTLLETLLNSIFQGIGTAIGMYIGTRYAVKKLEEHDKAFYQALKEKSKLLGLIAGKENDVRRL